MATRIASNIIHKFKSQVAKDFPAAKLKAAALEAAKEEIAIILERTNQGVDVRGKRFKPYSKSYKKQKQRFIKKGGSSNPFRANKLPNWMRRSGEMLSSIQVLKATAKPKGYGFEIVTNVGFKKGSDAEKKADWNINSKRAKRAFFGISAKGTKAYSKEQDRIKKRFFKKLGIEP